MNMQLDDTIRTVLDAQVKAIDVDIERPALTPAGEENASVIPFKRRTALVIVLTAAALIVGLIVVRANTPTKKGVVVSGTRMKIVFTGTPLAEYAFAHAPKGFQVVRDQSNGSFEAACTKWTVTADVVECSATVGGFRRSYTDLDQRAFGGSSGGGNLYIIEGEPGLPSAHVPYERVQVQGHDGWYTPNLFDDHGAADLVSPAVVWVDNDGAYISVAYIGLAEQPTGLTTRAAPSRTQLVKLANGVRTSPPPNDAIGFAIGGSPETLVGGPDSHPCAGFLHRECAPFGVIGGDEASFVADPAMRSSGVVVAMTGVSVASIRLFGDGASPLTARTTAVPGYSHRFVVIDVPPGRHPTTYELRDASGHVVEQRPTNPTFLPAYHS
jgi:hypothetical protein